MEELLVAALLADAGLAATVAARITWGARTAGAPVPALVLHKIDGPPTYSMDGRDRVTGYLVQMDCWAGTPLAAAQLARALSSAGRTGVLDQLRTPPLQCLVENDRGNPLDAGDGPQGSAPTNLFRSTLDVRVWATAA